jgi:hypothetical protein
MFIDRATNIATISNVDDNGSGLIRITSTAHGLTTNDTVFIAGVGGTKEANGTWAVTVVSTTQFTLQSSTYANAWTGGGGVYTGWRLQASLDSPDFDCVATLSVKRFSNGAVTSIETIAMVISATLTNLLVSDPAFAYQVAVLNILSTEGSGTINFTLQLRDKSNTVFGIAKADIPPSNRLAISGDGTSSIFTPDGMIVPPGP